jgi:hypothetical protein
VRCIKGITIIIEIRKDIPKVTEKEIIMRKEMRVKEIQDATILEAITDAIVKKITSFHAITIAAAIETAEEMTIEGIATTMIEEIITTINQETAMAIGETRETDAMIETTTVPITPNLDNLQQTMNHQ